MQDKLRSQLSSLCVQVYPSSPNGKRPFRSPSVLVVREASKKYPLHYFIYPYVEVEKPWRGKLTTRCRYREVSKPTLAYQGEEQTSRCRYATFTSNQGFP